jgi:hypothetical protein
VFAQMTSRSRAGNRKSAGNRSRRTPKRRTSRQLHKLPRQGSVVVTASLGAFLVGSIYGVIQAEQPWRGHGILANTGLVVGCGLVTTLVVILILLLTAARKRIAALIWR